MGGIDAQHPHCHRTHSGERRNQIAFQGEVIGPAVDACIEQAHELATFQAADVAALGSVTKGTAEGQIVILGGAAVLFTDYMIDMKTMDDVVFVKQAILTDTPGTSSN